MNELDKTYKNILASDIAQERQKELARKIQLFELARRRKIEEINHYYDLKEEEIKLQRQSLADEQNVIRDNCGHDFILNIGKVSCEDQYSIGICLTCGRYLSLGHDKKELSNSIIIDASNIPFTDELVLDARNILKQTYINNPFVTKKEIAAVIAEGLTSEIIISRK